MYIKSSDNVFIFLFFTFRNKHMKLLPRFTFLWGLIRRLVHVFSFYIGLFKKSIICIWRPPKKAFLFLFFFRVSFCDFIFCYSSFFSFSANTKYFLKETIWSFLEISDMIQNEYEVIFFCRAFLCSVTFDIRKKKFVHSKIYTIYFTTCIFVHTNEKYYSANVLEYMNTCFIKYIMFLLTRMRG